MKLFLIWFAFAFIFKLLSNTIDYFRIKKLRAMYDVWINNSSESDYYTYRREVINLFKKAGIKDQYYKIGKTVGYNTVVSNDVSIFQVFPANEPSLTAPIDFMFAEAVGYFRKGIFDCLNPIYWLDLVIFCPKYLLDYIGIDMNKVTSKVLHVVLNVLWWLIGIIFACFQPEAKAFIIKSLG